MKYFRVFNSSGKRIIKRYNYLRLVAEEIFIHHSEKVHELNIIIMNDEELREMNKHHLNHDYYTDILTFEMPHQLSSQEKMVELFLSLDRIKENASKFDVSWDGELDRVFIHGCLHVCGYADDTDSAKSDMRIKEDFYLKTAQDLKVVRAVI